MKLRLITLICLVLLLGACGDDGTQSHEPATPQPAQEGSYRNDPGVEFFDVEHADGDVYRCIYIYAERDHMSSYPDRTGGPALWCEHRVPR